MHSLSTSQADALNFALSRANLGLNPSARVRQFFAALCESEVDVLDLIDCAGLVLYAGGLDEVAPDTSGRRPKEFLAGEHVRAYLLAHKLERAADMLNVVMQQLYADDAPRLLADLQLPRPDLHLASAALLSLEHGVRNAGDEIWENEVPLSTQMFFAAHGEEVESLAVTMLASISEGQIPPASLLVYLSYLDHADVYGIVGTLRRLKSDSFTACETATEIAVPGWSLNVSDLLSKQGMDGDFPGLTQVGIEMLASQTLRFATGSPEILPAFVELLRVKYWEAIDIGDPPFRPIEVVQQIWDIDRNLSIGDWGRSRLTFEHHETLLLCWAPESYWADADFSELPDYLPVVMRLGNWFEGDLYYAPWHPTQGSVAADTLELFWRTLRSHGLHDESDAAFCIALFLFSHNAESSPSELIYRFEHADVCSDSLLTQTWRAISRLHSDETGPLAIRLRRLGEQGGVESDPIEQAARARLLQHLGGSIWLGLPPAWKQHLLAQERLWISSSPSASTVDCSHLVLPYFKFIELQILDRYKAFARREDMVSALNSRHFPSRPLAAPDRASISDALRVIKLAQRKRLTDTELSEFQALFPGAEAGIEVNTLFELKAWRDLAAHDNVPVATAIDARKHFLDPAILQQLVELLGPIQLRKMQ